MAKMTNSKIIFFVIVLLLEHFAEAGVIDFFKDAKLLKHLQIHQCRQKCFTETLTNNTSENKAVYLMDFNTCRGTPDCYMCYDYCDVLPKAAIDLALSMCSDNVYCSKGCRIACAFHKILEPNSLVYDIVHQ